MTRRTMPEGDGQVGGPHKLTWGGRLAVTVLLFIVLLPVIVFALGMVTIWLWGFP